MKRAKFYFSYLLLFILLYTCSGCSAQWHVKKAYKKDSALFDTLRVTAITKVPLSTGNFEFDCWTLTRAGSIELYSPIFYTEAGKVKKDSAKIVLNAVVDSTGRATGEVKATVDCPPNTVTTITETVPPIILKPSPMQMISYASLGFLIGFLLCLFMKFKG